MRENVIRHSSLRRLYRGLHIIDGRFVIEPFPGAIVSMTSCEACECMRDGVDYRLEITISISHDARTPDHDGKE